MQQAPHDSSGSVALAHLDIDAAEIQIKRIIVGRDADAVLKRGDCIVELTILAVEDPRLLIAPRWSRSSVMAF
jgi:hypothetical protein